MRAKSVPEGYHTVTPYLVVPGVDGLIRFLTEAFDAEEVQRPPTPDGRIAHAEVRIGDSRVMMGEPMEAGGAKTAMLFLYVDDADASYQSAIRAGATCVREPRDEAHGDRMGGVQDAWGNQWWLATPI